MHVIHSVVYSTEHLVQQPDVEGHLFLRMDDIGKPVSISKTMSPQWYDPFLITRTRVCNLFTEGCRIVATNTGSLFVAHLHTCD